MPIVNRTLVKLALLAACGVLLSCSESKEIRSQRFLEQGNDMVEKKNYEQAIKYYQNALGLDSCFSDAWNNLGTVHHGLRDFQAAIMNYSRAIECDPAFVNAWINRANTYYESGEMYNALADLQKVEKRSPDTVALHLLRGLVFTGMKRYPEAKRSFKAGLLKAPENTDLLVNIGNVLYFEGDYDSARMFLQGLIDKDIVHPNGYNTLALVECESGHYPAALQNIGRALELDPSNAYYLNNRGYIYLLMKDYDKALTDINESITSDPYNAWAYRNKGILALNRNDPDEALRLLKYAASLDPEITDLNYYMGEALWTKNDRVQACVYFAKSLKLKDRMKPDPSKKC